MDTTIIVRIDTKEKEKAQRVAEKSRRNLSDYIRLLLEWAVKEEKQV